MRTDTKTLYTCGDLRKRFDGSLFEAHHRRFTCQGVDVDPLRTNLRQSLEPGSHILFSRVVDALPGKGTLHEHRLNNATATESLDAFDHLLDVVTRVGPIHQPNVISIDRIEFQTRAINQTNGLKDIVAVQVRGVGEQTHLGLRTVFVSQRQRIAYDIEKVRVRGRFAVTRIRNRFGQIVSFTHRNKPRLKRFAHSLARGHFEFGTTLVIETAFTVNTVKTADLAVCWRQVDSQALTQTPTANGPENGPGINDGTHQFSMALATTPCIAAHVQGVCNHSRTNFSCSSSITPISLAFRTTFSKAITS